MSEVKWFKITTDIFDDEKIKYIETLPDSDTLIVIWFKLLSLCAKSNRDGYIMLTEKIPYTQEMLVSYINRKPNVVRAAISTFEKLGMIEITDENAILISNWHKHQNVIGLEKIREQNRIRQQRYREKNKELENKESEQETEEERDIEGNVKDNVTRNVTPNIPYKEIVGYLNEQADRNFKHTTKKTQSLIKARWNEGNRLDDFKYAIDRKVEEWKDTDMDQYLRPDTLFGTKFEGYLNQKPLNKNKGNTEDEKALDEAFKRFEV